MGKYTVKKALGSAKKLGRKLGKEMKSSKLSKAVNSPFTLNKKWY
jgi:hypothetical protein